MYLLWKKLGKYCQHVGKTTLWQAHGKQQHQSRVDSHNAKIKHISLSSDKMHEALEGIVKLSYALMQVAGYCPCSMKICTFYSYEASSNMTPYAPRTWLVMLALQSTNKQPKLGKHHQYSRQFMLSQVLVAHGMRVQVRAKEKTAKGAFWSGHNTFCAADWSGPTQTWVTQCRKWFLVHTYVVLRLVLRSGMLGRLPPARC